MHRFHILKIEVSHFNRSTLASHICSTDSIPWVYHSREEGSLDYDGRLVRLQVYLKFNTIIHHQTSHEFTFGVGMNFISYPLVLTPVV
jgi:hypothetical protein